MPENVLVIGSGGREHAIIWRLSQSSKINQIYAAPGSFGIQQVSKTKNVPLVLKNFKVKYKTFEQNIFFTKLYFQEIIRFCKDHNISLVVVGPEDPLANGIADALTENGIYTFGPQKTAAQIESDKDWAKSFMERHNIPTAKWKAFKSSSEAKNFIKRLSIFLEN